LAIPFAIDSLIDCLNSSSRSSIATPSPFEQPLPVHLRWVRTIISVL
jgi:hypothetical protein